MQLSRPRPGTLPATFVVISGLLCASTAVADNEIVLNADLGYTRISDTDGIDGVGADAYVGYHLGQGLVPELQVGYHYAPGDPTSTTIVPIMLGARYQVDLDAPVTPFIGAHLGLDLMSRSGRGIVPTTDAWFGFNLAIGATYDIKDDVGVGASLLYWTIFGEDGTISVLAAGLTFKTAL